MPAPLKQNRTLPAALVAPPQSQQQLPAVPSPVDAFGGETSAPPAEILSAAQPPPLSPDIAGAPPMSPDQLPLEMPTVPMGNDLPAQGGITGRMPNAYDPANTAPPPAADVVAARTSLLSPYYDRMRINEESMDVIRTMPITDEFGRTTPAWEAHFGKQDSRLQSGVKAFLSNIRRNPHAGAIRSWGDLAGMLSGAAGAGIGGAVRKTWNEEEKRLLELAKLQTENERLGAIADKEQKAIYQQAQIRNLEADNVRADAVAVDRKQAEADKLREQKRTNFYRQNQYFDPTKATAAQVKQLAEFGETPFSIGHYDVTKPNVKVINGVSFLWNPATRSFDDSNLPKDDSKAITEYTVQDMNTGVEYKYSTTNEKAAQLRTQLLAAGMQIKAASERQNTQNQFTSQRDQVLQKMRMQVAEFNAAQQAERQATDITAKASAQQKAEAAREALARLQKELDDQY